MNTRGHVLKQMKVYYIMLLIGVTFLVTVVADVTTNLSNTETVSHTVIKRRSPAWMKFRPKVQKIVKRNTLPDNLEVVKSQLH